MMKSKAFAENPVPNAGKSVGPEPSPAVATSLPADFRAEVARYDREAEPGVWAGPSYRMHYRVLGQGPPLVLVPGIAATYRVYALLLNRLAERFRTIVFDYPGDRPDDGARLLQIGHEDLLASLFGLIDHLGLERALLYGPSFGSTITLKALRQAPERFPLAALQGGFAHRQFRWTERLAILFGRRFSGTVSRIPFHDATVKWQNKRDFPAALADRWPHFIEQNGLTPIASLTHRLNLLAGIDLRPILPDVTSEVLLIQGTADRLVDRRHYDELHARLPNARGFLMPGAGHQPHYTHAEELAERITAFFHPRIAGQRWEMPDQARS